MNNISKHFIGSQGAATGVIGLYAFGLPAHMLPTADRLDEGSASQGEQRVEAVNYVFVGDTPSKAATVTITGTATVQLQGTNDDPHDGTSATWTLLGTEVTASGAITSDVPVAWVRLNKTVGTGTVVATLVAEG